uniref:DNA2/NAM7 helicase helicase domain-containing protein n=1 Tax=Panagrolaimus davidi TaxID=227884 RepID=A0A914Q5C0_9BILA
MLPYGSYNKKLNVKPTEPLPFEKYLVYGYTETRLPQYTDGTNLFDFSCIFTDDAKNELPTTRSNVTELKRIPIENFILNESQFNAFTYALESEIALIQGPPGTGKSYIGLQLAKFLLNENNWLQWNHRETPLLIVCYTNHALDQFLKGICDFADDKIVRVGSKCKDRVVIKYMMHQWRKEFSNQNHRTLIGHTKRLDREIVKLRSYFKQLNSGLACREAMLFISDNEFLTDERFIEWLTLWNPTKKIYELNVQIIKELIGKGVTESKAREAYASACTKRKNMEDIDVNDLYKKIKRGNFYIGEYKHHTRHWPLIKDIEAVMDLGLQLLRKKNKHYANLGYSEKVAIALLQNANMDVKVIKEECKKYPVKIEKKVEILSDDEGDFKEDPILKLKNEKEKERRKQERKLPIEVEEFGEYIRSVPVMKDYERKDITDIWKTPLQKRWRLYQHWVQEAIVLTKQNLEVLERDYYFYKNQVNELNKELDREILKSAKVIGMTTTGAAKYQSYLKELKPAIVIAEEAAEVLEAHIFTSLTSSCQQLILIGDHQQLRPNTSEYKLKDYHFDVSLFERLIRNGFSHKMLTTQHRMRPVN